MAVQLRIEYDQILDLVEQLPQPEQQKLIARVLLRRAEQRPLTREEKISLFEAAQLDNAVNENPSVRREDWYGDDGR